MSNRNVLLAIHNFSEVKSLANNAKIRSSLKLLLIRYQWYNSLISWKMVDSYQVLIFLIKLSVFQ